MGRRRRTDDDEIETAEDGSQQNLRLVPQDLTEDQVRERRIELANKTIELLDHEEKRARSTKKTNDRIKELKSEIRELAQEVRTGVEMVPAQLALEDAVKSRRSVQRSRQDNGAATGAEP